MFEGLRIARGVARSLFLYYGNRRHGPAMDRLYARLVQPGDLVFDIGAHGGDPVAVPMTTLDALVARHGQPAFIKIDVEGFEAEALAGLTRPPPALSFEFTTIQRAVAFAALERCAALGFERFDAALGESQTLVH